MGASSPGLEELPCPAGLESQVVLPLESEEVSGGIGGELGGVAKGLENDAGRLVLDLDGDLELLALEPQSDNVALVREPPSGGRGVSGVGGQGLDSRAPFPLHGATCSTHPRTPSLSSFALAHDRRGVWSIHSARQTAECHARRSGSGSGWERAPLIFAPCLFVRGSVVGFEKSKSFVHSSKMSVNRPIQAVALSYPADQVSSRSVEAEPWRVPSKLRKVKLRKRASWRTKSASWRTKGASWRRTSTKWRS